LSGVSSSGSIQAGLGASDVLGDSDWFSLRLVLCVIIFFFHVTNDRMGYRRLVGRVRSERDARLWGGEFIVIEPGESSLPKDVIEDEEAVRLFGQKESLCKLAPRTSLVGHLAKNLNDDPTVSGGLRVDIRYEDLAVVEIQGHEFFVNFLNSY
jgi:hypothetical protein